jgi:hypothetical protein
MEIQRRNRSSENVAVVADTTDLLSSKDSPLTKIRLQWSQLRANLQVLLSPGDKQFKDLPKRVRLMVVSFGIPMLYSLSKLVIFQESTSVVLWGIMGIVLATLTYIGMYWGLKGQIRKDSYFSVLLLPSIFVFANILFLSTIFIGGINRLYLWGLFAAAIAMFMTVLYILSLAVNILNVTLFYSIPLSRLGETVAYISSIITLFLISYATTDILIPQLVMGYWWKALITVVCLFAVMNMLTSALLRYFLPYVRGFWLLVSSITVSLILIFLIFVLAIPYAWLVGILLSLMGYILYGYVIHKEQNTYKSTVIVEFWTLLIMAFLAVVLV